MAVTSAQAVLDLVALLKTSPLVSGSHQITGKVQAFQRPLNSTKEDVIVNSLTLDRDVVQKGMLNVNLYVPNELLQNKVTGEVDASQPDMERLAYLSQVASDFLKDHWYGGGTLNFEVQSDNLFPDKNNEHYINLRVEFRALNV